MSKIYWPQRKPLHLRGRAILKVLLLLSLLVGIGGEAVAQGTEPAHKTPKIALVLSGGGALGLAHVGVIQELERMNLRPDFVVGTSMGSIVGGLYASGLDGPALERVVEDLNAQKNASAEALIGHLVTQVMTFSAGTDQADDVTVLAVRVL